MSRRPFGLSALFALALLAAAAPPAFSEPTASRFSFENRAGYHGRFRLCQASGACAEWREVQGLGGLANLALTDPPARFEGEYWNINWIPLCRIDLPTRQGHWGVEIRFEGTVFNPSCNERRLW